MDGSSGGKGWKSLHRAAVLDIYLSTPWSSPWKHTPWQKRTLWLVYAACPPASQITPCHWNHAAGPQIVSAYWRNIETWSLYHVNHVRCEGIIKSTFYYFFGVLHQRFSSPSSISPKIIKPRSMSYRVLVKDLKKKKTAYAFRLCVQDGRS